MVILGGLPFSGELEVVRFGKGITREVAGERENGRTAGERGSSGQGESGRRQVAQR